MRTKGYTLIILILLAVLAAFSSCGKKTKPQKTDIVIATPEIDTTDNIGDTINNTAIDSALNEIPTPTAKDSAIKKAIIQAVKKETKGATKITKKQVFKTDGITTTITPATDKEPAKISIQRPESKKTYTIETDPLPLPEKKSWFDEVKSLLWLIILFVIVTGVILWLLIKKE